VQKDICTRGLDSSCSPLSLNWQGISLSINEVEKVHKIVVAAD
jgi:hypothetical protein